MRPREEPPPADESPWMRPREAPPQDEGDEKRKPDRADWLPPENPRGPEGLFFVYGHIGDGNIHLSAWAGGTMEQVTHEMDEIVYGEVRRIGGSISAEHGIGTLKRDYLGHSRSPAEIEVMRRIKAALDPNGILHPGKVV